MAFFIKSKGKYYAFSNNSNIIINEKENFEETLKDTARRTLGTAALGTLYLKRPTIYKIEDKLDDMITSSNYKFSPKYTHPSVYRTQSKLVKEFYDPTVKHNIVEKIVRPIFKLDNKIYKTAIRHPKATIATLATIPVASGTVAIKNKVNKDK